jgi:lipoic acid synthetase
LSTGSRPALLVELGTVEYGRALEFQRAVWQLRCAGEVPDTLVLLEHPPVITLGKSAHAANILAGREALANRGVAVHHIERGGDVTFHGPGQLVGYPIFHLREGLVGVRAFVEKVEAALVSALQEMSITARVRDGLVGVWVEDRKIASLGIAVRRGITLHGFALNISTDLQFFRLINPCGMADIHMTSVAAESGVADERQARASVAAAFERVFGLEFQRNLPRSLTSLTNGLVASAIASASASE